MKPKGRLLLAYEPPSPSSKAAALAKLQTALTAGGLTRVRDVSATRAGKLQLGVIAMV
jgi:hypothetical protein